MARWILVLGSLASLGCALGDGRRADGGADASTLGMDAGARDGGAAPTDAGGATDAGTDRFDAGFDAGFDASFDAGPGGSLDPRLDRPDPGGAPCSTPGSLGECPSAEVCRFFTSGEGRCESCGPCGNLGASCASSAECDILFMCFDGRCTNFCTLGTSECGAPGDCLDVGHPTRGVCRP